MNLRRCANGHFYDADKHSSCPYCRPAVHAEEITVALDPAAVAPEMQAAFGGANQGGFWQTPEQPVYAQPAPAPEQPVYAEPIPAPEQPVYAQPAPAPEQPVYAEPIPEPEQPVYAQPAPAPEQPVYAEPAPAPEQPVYAEPAPAPEQPMYAEPAVETEFVQTPETEPMPEIITPPSAPAPEAVPTPPSAPAPEAVPTPPPAPAPAPVQTPPPAPAPQPVPVPARRPEDDDRTVAYFKEPVGKEPVVGWLVCIEGDHYGAGFELHAGRNMIGRGEDMDVALTGDMSVSRDRHAILIYEPRARYFVAQAGDSRGILYLNDEMVLTSAVMKDRDVISVGNERLMLVILCGPDFRWEDHRNQR